MRTTLAPLALLTLAAACQLETARLTRPCSGDTDCTDGKVCRSERCVVASTFNSAPRLTAVTGDGTALTPEERTQLATEHGGTAAPSRFARALLLSGDFLQGKALLPGRGSPFKVELVGKTSGARRELAAAAVADATGRELVATLPLDLAEGLYDLVVSTAYGETAQEVFILRGEKGETGDTGETGQRGEKGEPGTPAPTYSAGAGIVITLGGEISVDAQWVHGEVSDTIGPLDAGNPMNHPRYTDAEARAAMGPLDAGNPMNHPRYTDAEAVAAMGPLDAGNPLNHDRYTDTEAVTAMGPNQSTNPLNHNRFTTSEARSAMGTKANDNPLNHDRYTDAEAQTQADFVLGTKSHWFWEAESTGTAATSLTSTNEADATASAASARKAGGANPVVWQLTNAQVGRNMARGPVRLSARMKASAIASSTTTVNLACAAKRSGDTSFTTLGQRPIAPASFSAADTWSTFTVLCDFRPNDTEQSLALTDYAAQGADVFVDFVTMEPAGSIPRCYKLETTSTAVTGGATKDQDCPDGAVVTGGGCDQDASNVRSTMPHVVSGAAKGWRCIPAGNANVKVFAICCDAW